MEAALATIRALHFAACIVLFGGFVYACCVSPDGRARPRFLAVSAWSLALAILTALAWLAIEAGNMSGEPVARALRDGTLAIVLGRTFFGHTWMLRGALALAIAAALAAMRSSGGSRRTLARTAGAACAGLFLATLSGAGHAAAAAGLERVTRLCVDAVHLLAAGAWLGALVPFASLLLERSPARGDVRVSLAARRFSLLGMACVGALVLSGFVNATYTLRHVSALLTSRYGQELLAKLVLFAIVVALAVVNRFSLTPRLESTDAAFASAARRKLLRNALAEIALGFAIVAIVGALGITMPPMHPR